MRDDRLRLEDVLDLIEQIEKYSVRGREAFQQRRTYPGLVLHHLGIIGELAEGSLRPSVCVTRMRFGQTPLASETCSYIITLVSTTKLFGR